jgi:hypothetical protein
MNERVIAAFLEYKDLNVAWRYIQRPRAVDALRHRFSETQINSIKETIRERLEQLSEVIKTEFPDTSPPPVDRLLRAREALPAATALDAAIADVIAATTPPPPAIGDDPAAFERLTREDATQLVRGALNGTLPPVVQQALRVSLRDGETTEDAARRARDDAIAAARVVADHTAAHQRMMDEDDDC